MQAPDSDPGDEQVEVWGNRYQEARRAGMEHMDAIVFARSDRDIGELRMLVAKGCPPTLLPRIVL